METDNLKQSNTHLKAEALAQVKVISYFPLSNLFSLAHFPLFSPSISFHFIEIQFEIGVAIRNDFLISHTFEMRRRFPMWIWMLFPAAVVRRRRFDSRV